MTKLILFIIAVFVLAGFLNAQDPPQNLFVNETGYATWEAPAGPTEFYEDFEGTFPPDGWLKLNPDGGTGWEPLAVGTTPLPGWTGGVATACPDGGQWQAFCTWTTGGAVSNDQWLITPQITVQEGDMLDFWMIYYMNSYADYIEILISTTVQNTVGAFTTIVDEISFPTGSPTDWAQYTYTLTDFVAAGTPVYIAFREVVADNYNDGSAISIDNVMVGIPVTQLAPVVHVPQPINVAKDLHYTHVPNTHVVNSRDFLGYNVYLDGGTPVFVTDLFYQYTGLTNGVTYLAEVTALYDEGESDPIEYEFTYLPVEVGDIVVAATELKSNYPNPFNPETNIAFSIKEAGYTTLEVYNMKGQLVKTLVNEVKESGNYAVTWNGTNNSDRSVASGVYFYKMISEGNSGRYTSTKKMILLK